MKKNGNQMALGQTSKLNPKKLSNHFNAFKKLKVLIVGDVGIDRYTHGVVERISPEAPVPVVRVTEERLKLGLAANVAENISLFGAEVELVGLIGEDRWSVDFLKLLKDRKLSSQGLVKDSSRQTIVKERVVSDRQQLLRVDYETTGEISQKIEKSIFKKIENGLKTADIFIIQDYAKGMLTAPLMEKMLNAAKSKGVIVAVDPNAKSPAELYRTCSFLTPNLKEAESLSGVKITDEYSLTIAGKKLLEKTLAAHVVITRGKDGMALFEKGSREIKLIPTYAREVYDVSGAGDTVIGLMSLAIASGMNMSEAAILGNLGAGVVVGKRGTATVNAEELLEALEMTSRFGKVTIISEK